MQAISFQIANSKLLFAAFLLCLSANMYAQLQQPKPKPDKAAKPNQELSDPKARVVLDKVKKTYDAMNGFQADFVIETELGDERGKDRKGKVIIKGSKYYVQMAEGEFVSDGKKRWTYLKKSKEVQVSNASDADESGLASPAELLNIYNKPNFIYALMGENVESGKTVQKIEFKPVKGFNDYSKVRVTVDKNTNQMTNLKVFEKSGARYTLKLTNVVPYTGADATFTFDKSKFPDVKEVNLD
jgi:outer membrane lipoprotein carrier protein